MTLMNSLLPFCDPKHTLIPLTSPSSLFLHTSKIKIKTKYSLSFTSEIGISLISVKPSQNLNNPSRSRVNVRASAADEIDMVRNKDGVYAAKRKKVVVLWDLDNKPPRGPPYAAATALIEVAQRFGDVIDISAYANRHAFVHLPQWVLDERREQRRLDFLERKGMSTPGEPYICGVCGRKCRTNLDLKKHFKQLHLRERQKKLNRMRSLKGKKRQRYKEKFISGNTKYEEAERSLIAPKIGYGLASELRRAGVFVKTVEDKPQAADWALKRQMQHSMSRGIDWLFLVSDDSDFADMLRRARESNLGTVVIGDWHRALGRHADLWFPWSGVENREVTEEDLRPRSRRSDFEDRDDGLFSVTHFGGDGIDGDTLDSLVDELVAKRSKYTDVNSTPFSEGEEDWTVEELDQRDRIPIQFQASQSLDEDDDYILWDSEDEEAEEDDGYL